jgi:hypothetical protein
MRRKRFIPHEKTLNRRFSPNPLRILHVATLDAMKGCFIDFFVTQ